MTFGEDQGWGASVEVSERIMDRYIELGAPSGRRASRREHATLSNTVRPA